MAIQRIYTIKAYDQDGSTRLANYNTQRPEGSTTGYVKSAPTFKSQINGGYGECVIDLALPFDDFGEGTTINFMNIVKIYAAKVDDDTLTQSETLIYTGFISKYEPYIDGPGDEGVRVTLLGLVSLTALSYYKSGSAFAVTHTAADPSAIGQAIITHFNTIYGGSLLSYTGGSIDSVGTNVTFTFTDQTWAAALKKAWELSGTNWWWKIDASGVYYLKQKPSTATHTFTIGKDIARINAPKDSEKVVNDVQVRRTGGTASNFSDSTSQSTFGTGSPATGKRTRIIDDTSIADATTATQRGNKEINDNKDEKITTSMEINTNYDIESVEVGETCKIRNFDGSSTFFDDNMMIVAVQYNGDTITIELEEQTANLGNELSSLISSTAISSTSGTSGGGGGSVASFVDRETPTGSVNSSNTAFSLASTPVSGSEHVYLDGVLQTYTTDYTASGANLTFVSAPLTGAVLRVSYRTDSGSFTFSDRETPSGSINSSNVTFTLAHTPTSGSECVYMNGVLQTYTTDYTISGSTITFVSAPLTGAVIVVSYRY